MAHQRLILDTSGYSAFRRGLEVAVDSIQRAERIFVPSIVLGELLFGFALGTRPAENRQDLNDFLSSSRVVVSPITLATAERYAQIHTHLRAAGKPIPTNDLWIAAGTWEHGGVLLTSDGHFHQIPQIMIQMII